MTNKLVLAALSFLVALQANATIDTAAIQTKVDTMVTDGTSAITIVGLGLIGLASVAVVFRWVRASFF